MLKKDLVVDEFARRRAFGRDLLSVSHRPARSCLPPVSRTTFNTVLIKSVLHLHCWETTLTISRLGRLI